MDKVQFLKWLLAKLKYTDIEQIEENIDFKGIFDLHAKYHGAYKFGGDRQVQKLKAVSNIFNK